MPASIYADRSFFILRIYQYKAMKKSDKYVGINNDIQGGMTSIGKIIRDAWVFGLIPEDETCEGWNLGSMPSGTSTAVWSANCLLNYVNAMKRYMANGLKKPKPQAGPVKPRLMMKIKTT